MLNKEEFKKENLLSALKALDCSRNCPCCKCFDNNTQKCQDPTPYAVDLLEEFIQEHFELVEKHEMLENTYSMFCEDYLNPKSYKFEDLQTEMQVYDNYLKECIEISVMCGRNRANHTVTFFRWGQEELEVVKFEENRFYPVQMANVRYE